MKFKRRVLYSGVYDNVAARESTFLTFTDTPHVIYHWKVLGQGSCVCFNFQYIVPFLIRCLTSKGCFGKDLHMEMHTWFNFSKVPLLSIEHWNQIVFLWYKLDEPRYTTGFLWDLGQDF